jgi:hypothetical protein
MTSLQRLQGKLQETGGWTPNVWDAAITTQGPSRLLRALKRTRAPLTAFGMTIRFCRESFWFSQPFRQGWLGPLHVFTLK